MEGEADFVILYPQFGLLVLEVKGGDVRQRVENDREIYYRNLPNNRKKDLPQSPFTQASGNLHAIEDILKLRQEPFWFGGCRGYAILAASIRANSCLGTTPRIGGFPITDDFIQWRSGQAILFSTITAFKGLEAEAVILLNTRDNSHITDLDRYVATSRAKHLLAVILGN